MIEPCPPGVRPYGDLLVVTPTGDNRFGAHFNAEMALIRSMLLSYGIEPDYVTCQAIRIKSYDRNESYAEYQKRVLFPRWAAQAKPSNNFTQEELAFLVEHFDGANHPLAQTIQAKARGRCRADL